MYFGTSYGGTSGARASTYSLPPKAPVATALSALPSYTSSSYLMTPQIITTRPVTLPTPSVSSPQYSFTPVSTTGLRQASPTPQSQQEQQQNGCKQCETARKQTTTVEVSKPLVDPLLSYVPMYPCTDCVGPVLYYFRLWAPICQRG